MIEKPNPDQKTDTDDNFDDDPIIELTDEVKIKPDADRKIASPKSDDFMPPKAEKGPSVEDDEDTIVFEEYEIPSSQQDPYSETDGQSASDDVVIMDDGQDKAVGDSAAIIDDGAIDMTANKTRNKFDEKIELEYEIEEDEIDLFAGEDERTQGNDVTTVPSEASPTFGQDDNSDELRLDGVFEPEAGEEIVPLNEMDDDDVEADEDIIEITEFDQHFSDDNEILKHAGQLDPSDLADEDFLELFDIEEENPVKDEEMKELSESEEKAVEAELSRFFDEASEDETGIENIAPQHSEIISEQDTESAASDEGDTPVLSPEQIDRAIERIINEKLAGRIEHIIYEVIEKAVKKEIARLKESLLEDSSPDDNL